MPLAEIGWLRGHKAALYWLGLLYRKPSLFEGSTGEYGSGKALALGFKICWHSLPYVVLLTFALHMALFELFDQRYATLAFGVWHVAVDLGIWLWAGLLFGLRLGFFRGRGPSWRLGAGLLGGLCAALGAGAVVGGLGAGLGFGFCCGLLGGFFVNRGFFGVRRMLIAGLGTALASFWLYGSPRFGLSFGLAYLTFFLRAYYWPPFLWLVWPRPLARFYPYHPVVWDDVCLAPYPGLSRLLVAYADHDPAAAEREIERLVSTYPAQRPHALRARTILLARQSSRIERLADLGALVARLPEGDRGYLRQTRRLRDMAQSLVALAARVDVTDVPALRAAEAAELCLRVREVRDQMAGFSEPLGSEFTQAAAHWQKLAESLRSEAKAVAVHASRPQVYRAGDKVVDREREAFVSRGAVIHELQQQLLLATGCPGIVLYGRRRVGKSSVLSNLDGFLPESTRTAVVSLHDPRAFTTLSGLCRELYVAIGRAMGTAQAGRGTPAPADNPPQTVDMLYQFIDQTNDALGRRRERLLLAIDEYENLDRKIGEGVFTEDLLACLRESLQSHREIIWVLAGSHEISELRHAPWASYLVSARTVEVPMFTLDETRALLTDPMKHAPMRREIWQDRPRFEPEFWGVRGVEAIHEQAGGWPHLVQLLTETLLDLANRESLAGVDPALFETGLDKAVVRGHNVLYQLLRSECETEEEWEYLSRFRRLESQPPPASDKVYSSLRRRLLVEDVGSEWRLRVPLMLRWLRQRG